MDTKNGLIRKFPLLFLLLNLMKENFVLQHQAQPLCAKFSSKSHIMVSGDNKNVITLWRLDKEFPITVQNLITYS